MSESIGNGGASYAVKTIEQQTQDSLKALGKSLSKTQRDLGLYRNEAGLLFNAQNKCVEGLSITQIRLGQYVDELGRVRTADAQYVADLNKIEQALGFYATATGDVMNAQGEFVRKTAEARRSADSDARAFANAANERAEAAQRVRQALITAAGGAAQAAGSFSTLFATLRSVDGDADGFREFATQASAGASAFFSTAQALGGGLEAIRPVALRFADSIAATGAASRLASVGLKTLSLATGPLGIAVAAAVAGIAAIRATGSGTSDVAKEFAEIEKRARDAGREIKSLSDALEFGAFDASGVVSEIRSAVDELVRLNESNLTREQAQAIEDSWNGVSRAINRAGFAVDNFLSSSGVEKEKKEQYAAINDYVAGLVEESRTEEEKTRAKIDELKAVLNVVDKDDQRAFLQGKIDELEAKIVEDKAKEESEARRKAEEAAGIADYLPKERAAAEATLAAYDATVDAWNRAAAEGRTTAETVAAARAGYDAKIKENLARDLGVSFESSKTAQEKLVAAFGTLDDALAKSVVDQEEYANAVRSAATGYVDGLKTEELQTALAELETRLETFAPDGIADETNGVVVALGLLRARVEEEAAKVAEKAAEEAARARESTRSKLGVDAANEERETPEDRRAAALAEIEKAFRDGAISEEEQTTLRENASRALADANERAAKESDERTLKNLGIDSVIAANKSAEDAAKSVAERLKEQGNALEAARERGEISDAAYSAAKDALTAATERNAEEERNKTAAATARENASIRSELGIDSLVESLKSPFEKYEDALNRIADAAAKGAISAEERIALESKAANDYASAWRDQFEESANAASRSAFGGDAKVADAIRNELKSSTRAGSTEAYLAQVKNSTSYQSKILSSSRETKKTLEASLEQSKRTNAYLDALASSQGPRVFRGA